MSAGFIIAVWRLKPSPRLWCRLCLGQGIGAFLLDGVLGCHYEEGLLEFEGVLANRHLALLHCLEQCTLHLGRSTVDLVGQDEVGEDGAFLDLESLALLAVNHSAYQVGGQQVGSELDAAELGIDGLGQSSDGQCLGQSGHTFEQHVTVRQQANHQALDHMFLSHNVFAHLHYQSVHDGALTFDALVQFLDVYRFVHNILSDLFI